MIESETTKQKEIEKTTESLKEGAGDLHRAFYTPEAPVKTTR